MSLKKINTVLSTAFILFILWFGVEFILSPETTAPGFGLPSWPSGDGDGFLIIKGIRDVVLALVLGILLVTGHRRALGWVLQAYARGAQLFGELSQGQAAAEPFVLVDDQGHRDAGGADLPGKLHGGLQLGAPGGAGGDLPRRRASSRPRRVSRAARRGAAGR
jgi:hypothetical protein